MLKLCYLPKHPDIKLYQDSELFKINTDTQVLGEFLNIYKEDGINGRLSSPTIVYPSTHKIIQYKNDLL